ncbi:FAD assembly factor SdhE [Ancylobacter lacus]|uniref:FAD assembly factor SdhE n=1 Tax=Ancylobacter lacus TaxID=2579970 RepID=UPI001BCED892|nr:succinate dehydrogenase assembly factor 2 [Ancylobacter lacus]MBS7539810.1 succinate dehydrogenase assembly factor 2 [Ancylobacter lacus]
MTGTTLSSAGLDPRRRRILFRAWHRGTREMDLLMGRFADVHLPHLSDTEVAEFERLIEVEDPDLFRWIGGETPPVEHDTAVFRRFRRFHLSGEGLPEM